MRKGKVKIGDRYISDIGEIEYIGKDTSNIKRGIWKCFCGNEFPAYYTNIRSGYTRSCGCWSKQIIEDNIKDPNLIYLNNLWGNIKQKCFNNKRKEYKNYGGRGISMYSEWKDNSKKFIEDILKEIDHRPTEKHSLDRKNNDGNYEPGNIRWATPTEQNCNTRNNILLEHNGIIKTATDIEKELNLTPGLICHRIKLGHSGNKLFEPTKNTIPSEKNKKLPPYFKLWTGIKQRCLNPKNPAYNNYGGRGITLFDPWINDYKAFEEYILTNLKEKPTPKHSLDRKDNNKGYEPGNLRWATSKEQARNKRNNILIPINGIEIISTDLANKLKINNQTLNNRFKSGWNEKDLLFISKKALFDQEIILNIKEDYSSGMTITGIAKKYNASIPTVRDVVRCRGAYKQQEQEQEQDKDKLEEKEE